MILLIFSNGKHIGDYIEDDWFNEFDFEIAEQKKTIRLSSLVIGKKGNATTKLSKIIKLLKTIMKMIILSCACVSFENSLKALNQVTV